MTFIHIAIYTKTLKLNQSINQSNKEGTKNRKITSGVLEHKWRASLKTILLLIVNLILTFNTQATKKKKSRICLLTYVQ